jgi:hypothetical protein
VRPNIHLHLVLWLRMSGAIPQLLYIYTALCLVKYRKHFHYLIREIGWEGVNWIHLAQDRDQWRALVNTVMNFWVP